MKSAFHNINILLMALVLLTACSKGFLERNPTDMLNATTYYTSKSSVDAALTSCYATLQNPMFTASSPYYDCMADNGYNYNNTYGTTTLSRGPIVPTSGGYIDNVYSTSYASIARYNIFLKTLSGYSFKDLSAADKLKYEAEARLMRAMKYFDLYRFYGEVPLVLEPLSVENQHQSKSTAVAVQTQIIVDIDFAISNLPNVSYAANKGHLAKAAAQVLKSRVLLFDAYNADGTSRKDIMANVKTITGDIMASSFYSISPSFRGLFCEDIGKQEGNTEFIFSVKFLAPNNPTATQFIGVAAEYIFDASSPGGALLPLKNFANEFEFKDGSSFSTSNPLYNPNNVYQNRDPRMSKTLFSDSVTFENGFTARILPSPTGYSYYKHVEGTDAQNIYANKNGSDWPAMRYAEVLLMYAEATNEVDGPSAGVYGAVNQIRTRADINMPPLPAGLTQAQMRDRIRHERRIELAFEGFRYDDIKRWKLGVQLLNIPASEAIINKTFVQKNYRLPLPQSQIDIDKGVLVQNPDYQ
ncbi:RagB/SusD family nutrient uptake outer membrane protein [Chitinophaga eiseniae]|uniref:RagB/SusD family nutrient uptake outer membrane protein n=1 Tax=Chitinophaga eiseniae TaxID=634771 RepID=A0A847SHP2_9BACT|nr:RagB/SusD family nutrient uptake outer membrane protein [Chitinophaga eiseniae]NLR79664.1 RagB/SusD family nutrient uptake outer membrane protein [Chitinophaga eiseniae]